MFLDGPAEQKTGSRLKQALDYGVLNHWDAP